MDATAQLALMTKAKLVFERDDTYLSFPALVPYSYDAGQLRAPTSQAVSPAQLLVLSEISRVVNSIPSGPLFSETGGPYLWEVLHQMYGDAELAVSGAGGFSSGAYDAACAELYAIAADGSRVDSPAVVTYNQFRGAYEAALSAYKAAQISAASTADPQALANWTSTNEPGLRAAVDAAMVAWMAQGGKLKVEQARQTLQAAATDNLQVTWSNWASTFNPDIDLMSDPNQISFALTGLSPSDFTASDWPTFTLDTAEISGLIAKAPAELAASLQSTASSDVGSISFQYCAVSLVRPWFQPEALAARFWKFSDPSVLMSDGKMPASGKLPAYISGIVFARRVVVTPLNGNAASQHLNSMPALLLRPEIAAHMQPVLMKPLIAAPAVHPAAVPHPVVPNPVAAGLAANAGLQNRAVNRAPIALVPARPTLAPALYRLNAVSFQNLPKPASPPLSPSPPPSPGLAPAPAEADAQMSVLAFICKRLPLCPDPDPGLTWPP